MSKVTIEIDTDTKEMDVAIDGKSVKNVSSVSAYVSKYSGTSLSIGIQDKLGDLDAMTTLYASESEEGKELAHAGYATAEEYPDFIEVTKASHICDDVAKYFKNR